MDSLRITPLTEDAVDALIEAAGGGRAHTDADRRSKRGADYLLGEAIIELKILEDDGLEKPERQAKLAALFRQSEPTQPVIVLARENLSDKAQRDYDRILEGPIKTAVRSARSQLRQSRSEHPDATTSILFVINNGYTALDHETLVQLVAHRVRNDTSEIDGVVVAGCYYYSDAFDSHFLWPIDYVPINLNNNFTSFNRLREAWNDEATRFMTMLMQRPMPDATKGPVVDSQFDVDGITYVKPAPPMGRKSEFYIKGRPRKNSTGLEHCPSVATTFPDMTRGEWTLFRAALPDSTSLKNTYEDWLVSRVTAASESDAPLKPFVKVLVTHDGWKKWCQDHTAPSDFSSVRAYANELFETKVREIISSARERTSHSLLPPCYILVATEEIGQDRANDVSHIAIVREMPNSDPIVRELIVDVRIFHEHALALAAAYAVAEGVNFVMWQKNLRYSWT